MKALYKSNLLLLISFILALLMMFFGGFREKETTEIITMVVTISVTMAGFGLIAFQIARVSNELQNDFIESSILMILSTMTGFIFLVYPSVDQSAMLNFGEISIFTFFWASNLFLITLIDKRLHVLR